jgi:hypothetical protein
MKGNNMSKQNEEAIIKAKKEFQMFQNAIEDSKKGYASNTQARKLEDNSSMAYQLHTYIHQIAALFGRDLPERRGQVDGIGEKVQLDLNRRLADHIAEAFLEHERECH